MKLQRAFKPIVLVVMLATLLFPAQAAVASTEEWTSGNVYGNQLNRYYNARTISYSPYEIAFKQYSGPQVFMRWWRCPNLGVVSYYWTELEHGQWKWLTYSYPDNTDFCIDVIGGGTGYFDGFISWDG